MFDDNSLDAEPAPNGDLVARLVSVIAPLVSPGLPYAMIDYPLYNNPGDAAIWVGARRLLERVMRRPPSYVATLGGFDAAACRRAVGDGVAFVLGGGNFGSLYPRHHDRKLAVIRALPDTPILHLPFSIAGTDPRCMDRTAETLARHGQVHLIAREGLSRDLIRAHLGQSVAMAPDTAHALLAPPHLAPARTLPILFAPPPPRRAETRLLRRDRETADRIPHLPGAEAWDWPDPVPLRVVNRLGKLAVALTRSARVMDSLAALRVGIACQRLAEGAAVTTDRLHGMILGTLLGRPVTALDNATGKLRAYLATWGPLLGPGSVTLLSAADMSARGR